MACTHGKAHSYLRDAILSGTKKFSRKNPHVQTVLKSAKNCGGCQSFIATWDLDTRLF